MTGVSFALVRGECVSSTFPTHNQRALTWLPGDQLWALLGYREQVRG